MQTLLILGLLFIGGIPSSYVDDLTTVYEQLKQAEAKADAPAVEQLASKAHAIAGEVLSSAAPDDVAEKERWTQTVAYARQVDLYSEFALFSTAVKGPAVVTARLISQLEAQNAKSKYLDSAYGPYFLALNQTGSGARIPLIAEKAIGNFPANEDLLLVLSENAMNRKQTDRALTFAERLIKALDAHAAPEGMSAAEWQRKRTAAMGRGRWIAGMMHSEKGQYFEADRDLRVALPLLSGNESMTASTLFYLGVANYQLGSMTRNRPQILEGARFSEQSAKLKGPLADQAWRNAQAMKAEATKIR